MRLLNHVRKRIAAHACRWQSLPTLQVRLEPRSDDDREFDSDMDYLDDLADAIDAETGIDITNPTQWCEYRGVETDGEIAWLYKAVDDAWTTERGTIYAPGATPEAPDWDTTPRCGGGLHLCATPAESLRYKDNATRFVRCGVWLDEIVCLGDKVKTKRVVIPCVEVDQFGNAIGVVS